MMYYVNWVLTNAQLELLAADVSVVDYDYGKDEKKKHKRGEFDDTYASSADVKAAADEWNKKYGGENGTGGWCDIKDILGGNAHQGVGINIE